MAVGNELYHQMLFDCVYFVSVDYDSITACTRKFLESSAKSFIRSLRRRRKNFVSVGFFRRREHFAKDRSARHNENRPRIVKIGATLAIFEPFKVLRHFVTNSADRPGVLYRNPLQIELSPRRLSKFSEKWRVRFSVKSGCLYYDVVI